MAKLDIIVAGNPVLRLKAKEVERIDKKTVRLLNDMAETMYAACLLYTSDAADE